MSQRRDTVHDPTKSLVFIWTGDEDTSNTIGVLGEIHTLGSLTFLVHKIDLSVPSEGNFIVDSTLDFPLFLSVTTFLPRLPSYKSLSFVLHISPIALILCVKFVYFLTVVDPLRPSN